MSSASGEYPIYSGPELPDLVYDEANLLNQLHDLKKQRHEIQDLKIVAATEYFNDLEEGKFDDLSDFLKKYELAIFLSDNGQVGYQELQTMLELYDRLNPAEWIYDSRSGLGRINDSSTEGDAGVAVEPVYGHLKAKNAAQAKEFYWRVGVDSDRSMSLGLRTRLVIGRDAIKRQLAYEEEIDRHKASEDSFGSIDFDVYQPLRAQYLEKLGFIDEANKMKDDQKKNINQYLIDFFSPPYPSFGRNHGDLQTKLYALRLIARSDYDLWVAKAQKYAAQGKNESQVRQIFEYDTYNVRGFRIKPVDPVDSAKKYVNFVQKGVELLAEEQAEDK